MSDKISTWLWFDTEGEEAAEFYCSLFPDSKITGVQRYGEAGPRPAGTAMVVTFQLDGRPFAALNGGPEFSFSEAVSLMVECEDQEEVDRYWNAFVGGGGQESDCGWCKDRYGFSWQIVPRRLQQLLADPDPARAQRAMAAMLQMKKIDVAALEAAADAA
jgi:predicted 3-demethylubiquinone-9 3-methyltransferase (glyoxalase superfamily)